jgi:hypothetical protein
MLIKMKLHEICFFVFFSEEKPEVIICTHEVTNGETIFYICCVDLISEECVDYVGEHEFLNLRDSRTRRILPEPNRVVVSCVYKHSLI